MCECCEVIHRYLATAIGCSLLVSRWAVVVYGSPSHAALTILLLELSYGTVHFPEGEELLPRIKSLMRWLRTLKKNDTVAARAYDVAFGVLQRLAPRQNADISELLEEDASFSVTSHSQSPSVMGNHEEGQQPWTGHLNYEGEMGHQSMFAFPSNPNQGDVLIPGHVPTWPLGSGADVLSFGNPFGTHHDEQNPLTFKFPA